MFLPILKTEPEWTQSLAGSNTIYSSSPERVGRDGVLSLHFERREHATVLARCRSKAPLQVLAPGRTGDAAFLMLLNPAGGIVGGDRLETEIHLRQGAHACLSTPAATIVYRTLDRPAIQRTTILMEEGSILEYFPEHIIPFAGSALRQSVKVEMAPRSRLLLYEAFGAGRIARGERWRFAELASSTEIRLRDRLLYLSRATIIPGQPEGFWAAIDFNYVASLLVFLEDGEVLQQLERELWAVIDAAMDVEGGVSRISECGCVVRLLAFTMAELKQVTQTLWSTIRRVVLAAPPLEARRY